MPRELQRALRGAAAAPRAMRPAPRAVADGPGHGQSRRARRPDPRDCRRRTRPHVRSRTRSRPPAAGSRETVECRWGVARWTRRRRPEQPGVRVPRLTRRTVGAPLSTLAEPRAGCQILLRSRGFTERFLHCRGQTLHQTISSLIFRCGTLIRGVPARRIGSSRRPRRVERPRSPIYMTIGRFLLLRHPNRGAVA